MARDPGRENIVCPSIVISTTIFMNTIIKMGKPLALISTLPSRKAFSFI